MENGEKKDVNGSGEKDGFKDILAYIETTDLEYVEVSKGGRKICLKRSSAGIPERRSPVAEMAPEPEPEVEKAVIRSPIVGRFHSSMGADRPSLVVEGEHVTAGQKVAIVEAMKIKKEVFSAFTGKVVKIHVRDGDAVEYGQELFTVEPDGDENK